MLSRRNERCEERDNEIEWLYCRDGKYRPIKSGISPLVNGVARGMVYSGGAIDANNTGLARAIRLKGYGNAIQAQTAQVFIESVMEILDTLNVNQLNDGND